MPLLDNRRILSKIAIGRAAFLIVALGVGDVFLSRPAPTAGMTVEPARTLSPSAAQAGKAANPAIGNAAVTNSREEV